MAPHRTDGIRFGPYRLYPRERSIERDGVPLPLGSRALDILIVLAERAGDVVSQRDLIARVWRDLVVTPSNLRVHIAGLRKALGDGTGPSRYIANIPGQGYCFVAPVTRRGSAPEDVIDAPATPPPLPRHSALPAALERIVGREGTVARIAEKLMARRFVSIVGPGGVGKSTVAISVAHALRETFQGAVCFVDLSALTDAAATAATIASALGLNIPAHEASSRLADCLRSRRMLLVLDNCEHVIETVAPIAERIFCRAPEVHLLATSREGLRVEGEQGHFLPPLETPPPRATLTAREALTFAAVRLFCERASAGDRHFQLDDREAPTVAAICHRLDGIALAIELGASQAAIHGVVGTARLLANRLEFQWRGRRTAHPRHQTLRAMIDWSYDPLSPSEQYLLKRMSTMRDTFSLQDVQVASVDADLTPSQAVLDLESLVSKCLVTVVSDGRCVGYRLLETIRDYAADKIDLEEPRALAEGGAATRTGSPMSRRLEAFGNRPAAPCLV